MRDGHVTATMRTANLVVLGALGVLAVMGGRASVVRADETPAIQCLVSAPLDETLWDGDTEIPSGYVKWAGWRDLRIRIDRPEREIRMEIFVTGERPRLPPEEGAPANPTWLPERQVLKEKDGWTTLGPNSMRAATLQQGEQTLMLGIHEDPEKRGGALLYWHHGLVRKARTELVTQWAPSDSDVMLRSWGEKLEPEIVPLAKRKQDDTWLVARKGTRVLAVFRYRPSQPGGDPYDRWLVSMDPEAIEKAEGELELEAKAPDRKLSKFMRDHTPQNWAQRLSVLVRDGTCEILVRNATDPELGVVYQIFRKPAE